MENLIGRTLNHYRITDLLGEGGMCAVYKGFDITLQRNVAIKVMHTQYSRRTDLRERFLQEARSAARLKHPSIVQVYDFGQEGAMLYIVMEYIAGDNLQQLLSKLKEQGNWIGLAEGIEMVKLVSRAVDYAHRNGVLHRDIKPSNVMIVPEATGSLDYRPVLTDLGLARLLEGEGLTREGESMGTPAYMSPEQALGEETDARSDVYSLGILLYELAVGRVPFPANSISQAIRYHTKEELPKPSLFRPEIDADVERVIVKALEKAPGERFSGAEALALALDGLDVEKIHAASETVINLVIPDQTLVGGGPEEIDGKMFAEKPDVSEDQIQVLSKDRLKSMLSVRGRIMTIGRTSENDIFIMDEKVSRQHARIEYDDGGYYIVDMGSSNGTFLANTRITSDVRVKWNEDQIVQVGDTWLHLIRARVPFRVEQTIVSMTSVGLMTQYQESIADYLGPSIMDEFGTVADVSEDHIQVLKKDGRKDLVLVMGTGMTIGRTDESEIVIEDGKISRKHARIEYDGREYYVVDLDSLNGTFLANNRLLPGVREKWNPDKVLRVGDTVLHLVRTGMRTEVDVSGPILTDVMLTEATIEAAGGQVTAILKPDRVNVETGGSTWVSLLILNEGSLVNHFTVQPVGIPPEWVTVPRQEVHLMPGEKEELKIRVHPPSRPDSRAGEHPLGFRTTCVSTKESADVAGTLIIEPYYQFRVNLRPQRVTSIGRGDFTLGIFNQCNAELTLGFYGEDPEGTCNYLFNPPQIVVPAGQDRSVEVCVQSSMHISQGSTQSHQFNITVSAKESYDLTL
ncbi:MAG: FHA domain-containing protein, partial [Anaerolineaceae bacterium]|nr:FHA domain-containing protein [Anaerolineaceae bacterium]